MEDQEKADPRDMAQQAMKQAHRAAKQGKQREAEQWLKLASRMAVVAERIAALPKPEIVNVEEIRAELRQRIAGFCPVAAIVEEWEQKREVRDAVAAFARAHNLPEPPELDPCPYTREHLEMIAAGKLMPLPSLDMGPIERKEGRMKGIDEHYHLYGYIPPRTRAPV